jgi:signal transduction histidine kinase/DNA-binding response OmpR family regulator
MKNLTILILLFVSFACWGQDKKLDSLYRALEGHPKKDTIRFGLLISVSEFLLSNPTDCKKYIDEALKLAGELNFKKGVAEGNYNLANFYWNMADYSKAIDYNLIALRGYEDLKNSEGLYHTYQTMAGIYVSLKDFARAQEYMNKVLALGETNKNLLDYSEVYFNMGFMTIRQNKFEEGIRWINKALPFFEARNDYYTQASCYIFLAKAKQELGDAKAALLDYKKSIQFNKVSNHPRAASNFATAHEGLGALYIKQKEYGKASLHLDTSYWAARQIKSTNMVIKIYHDRALVSEGLGNLTEALKFERLHKELSDSVFNNEKSNQLAEAQTKYEMEKKEQEIELLEERASIQTLWRNSLVAGLLLTLSAAVVIYALQRSRARKAKLLLETQQLLNHQMQEADKIKSRFFANISHEFRTPLTLIISPIEEKLSAKDIPQKEKISFQSIRRSANRLLELVNQLLELSKLESGFMKLQLQPGNLHHFIMPILSSFDSLADVGQVRYTKEVRSSEAAVLFDGDKLEKILSNLLSNAFKFSPKGAKIEVKILAADKGKSIELTVEIKNFGAVIPPDNLNKIFEPFFQGDNITTRGVPGTGLGLSLVKELVKLHGGDIRATSTDAEGTLFAVKILLDKTEMPAIAKVMEKEEAVFISEAHEDNLATEFTDAKETILIVEDNMDVRNLIRHGLEMHYNILEASTGKEGVDIALEKSVDMVVSDVMMPLMSGVELCHLLKNDERTSHLPIILLTARADHESKLEGLSTGADDYVVKPFNMQELQARISNLIAQRKKLIQKYDKQIVVQPHEITVTPMDERFLQKAIQLVEDNLDNTTFTSEKMSDGIGMSRASLHRKIKAITGQTTSEFIQDFRLRRAAVLIEKKTDTVSQIAYQVGFNDHSYFTKCFKKKFGKVPKEFGTHA